MAPEVLQVLASPILKTVSGKLTSIIQNEFGLVWGVDGEMEKLSRTLLAIQDVIEVAEVKQITDKHVRNWLRKLKDLAYHAEDILDECATEDLNPKSERSETMWLNNIEVLIRCLSSCFDFKEILFRHTIAKRIKKLQENFDEIDEERSKFHLNLINSKARDVEFEVKQHKESSSLVAKPHVFGREKEKDDIVNTLVNNDQDDLSICAILGMSGLGKTTLAQMVYNDERIENLFKVRCWVLVSKNFESKNILKDILESLDEVKHDLQKLDPLQQLVRKKLSGKRFLMVLDDVWNEERSKWEELKFSLSCGGRGSSIIITTQLQTVVEITATLPVCCPEVLKEEDCWSLFKHTAFFENETINPELEVIGKDIVKKCGGVPLAAKALGGLLCCKREVTDWLFVKESEIWDLSQDRSDAILPALRLSYNHLPLHLRQCFTYCSLFPKNYVMGKEELVHLWMANGFIQSKRGSIQLEDTGNQIFNELVSRSFFQVFEKDEDDKVVGCKMHDLMHDLASSIMGDECSIMELGKENVFGRRTTSTRHLSLVYGYSSKSSSSNLNSSLPKTPSHMRTLLRLHCWSTKQAPPLQLTF